MSYQGRKNRMLSKKLKYNNGQNPETNIPLFLIIAKIIAGGEIRSF
jgi:hypothetical protein